MESLVECSRAGRAGACLYPCTAPLYQQAALSPPNPSPHISHHSNTIISDWCFEPVGGNKCVTRLIKPNNFLSCACSHHPPPTWTEQSNELDFKRIKFSTQNNILRCIPFSLSLWPFVFMNGLDYEYRVSTLGQMTEFTILLKKNWWCNPLKAIWYSSKKAALYFGEYFQRIFHWQFVWLSFSFNWSKSQLDNMQPVEPAQDHFKARKLYWS